MDLQFVYQPGKVYMPEELCILMTNIKKTHQPDAVVDARDKVKINNIKQKFALLKTTPIEEILPNNNFSIRVVQSAWQKQPILIRTKDEEILVEIQHPGLKHTILTTMTTAGLVESMARTTMKNGQADHVKLGFLPKKRLMFVNQDDTDAVSSTNQVLASISNKTSKYAPGAITVTKTMAQLYCGTVCSHIKTSYANLKSDKLNLPVRLIHIYDWIDTPEIKHLFFDMSRCDQSMLYSFQGSFDQAIIDCFSRCVDIYASFQDRQPSRSVLRSLNVTKGITTQELKTIQNRMKNIMLSSKPAHRDFYPARHILECLLCVSAADDTTFSVSPVELSDILSIMHHHVSEPLYLYRKNGSTYASKKIQELLQQDPDIEIFKTSSIYSNKSKMQKLRDIL